MQEYPWRRASPLIVTRCQLQGLYCHFIPFLMQLMFLHLGRCCKRLCIVLKAEVRPEQCPPTENCLLEDRLAPWLSQGPRATPESEKSLELSGWGEGPVQPSEIWIRPLAQLFQGFLPLLLYNEVLFFKFALPLPPCTLQITAEAAGARAAAALKARQSSCCGVGAATGVRF